MHRLRLLLFFAAVLAGTSASGLARAQSVLSSTPDRLDSQGKSIGQTTRADSQNPLGISYADCTADQSLQFVVQLSGFTGNASLQVWASLGSPCVNPQDRGLSGGTAVCWGVSPSLVDPMAPTMGTALVTVRVQDLVGWQSTSPLPSPALTPPAKGSEACTAQPGFAMVPMLINFLAIDGDGNPVGVPYEYSIQTDLVGPPAPDICESVGDTIYSLTWTPNTDSDTVGYGIYVDPIPGQEGDAGMDAGALVVCPEAGATDGSGEDSGADSGCSTVPIGTMPANSGSCGSALSEMTCDDSNLVGAITPTASGDAGTPTPAPTEDGGEGGVEEGTGGISTVSTAYLYKPTTSTSGMTVDKSAASYQIGGLVNYVTYTVVVTAVDGMGNVGPPSTEVCDYPAPVQDFWQVYEKDGGGKGGYCALDAVGVGGSSLAGVAGAFVVAAFVRRRRRRG